MRTASPGGRYRPLSKSVPISQVERALSFIAFTVRLEFSLLVEFICLLAFVVWYFILLLLILELLHAFSP